MLAAHGDTKSGLGERMWEYNCPTVLKALYRPKQLLAHKEGKLMK
jgi:hypothetical protein